MKEIIFNLQLFADDIVDVDTLKDHFSDEDLQEYLPKEEPPAEPIEPAVVEPQQEEPVVADVTSEEDIPHADNLKAALKEERDRRKLLAAELAALKAQQPTPQPTTPAPQQPQQQQSNIEEQIAKVADEKVRKTLGITEDIETLQYSDPALYLKYVKSVAKEEFKLETQYEQQQTLYNQNKMFVSELQQQADFPVLYQFALAELDEMPGKQSKVIGSAFERIDRGIGTKEDQETIRKFTADCRAKMTGITTPVAPVNNTTTSPLDKAIGLPRAQALSGAKTSTMSWADVDKLASQGKFDQIPEDMLRQIHPELLK